MSVKNNPNNPANQPFQLRQKDMKNVDTKKKEDQNKKKEDKK